MKNVALILAMGFLMISTAFAGNNPSLKKLLNRKIKIDLSHIELDKYTPDYVNVSFKIVNGEIEITEIHGSQPELKKEITKALEKLDITCEYEEGETYQYKFTFEKI
jgi:hypothetical protein|tara:strand:- start:8251 stop:8571 length:321 start_codon:yes stop_codon:yes gene_type:complete